MTKDTDLPTKLRLFAANFRVSATSALSGNALALQTMRVAADDIDAAADEIDALRAQADEMAEALERCASRMRGKPQWDSEDAGPCQTLQLVETALARYRGEGT